MKTTSRPRRAPKGWTRIKPQRYEIGTAAPVEVHPYINRDSGAVKTWIDGHEIGARDMDSFKRRVQKFLTSRACTSHQTRHIATITVDTGTYQEFVYWPVLRQEAGDGTVWWADVQVYDGEIDWDDLADSGLVGERRGFWIDTFPRRYTKDGRRTATIIDYSVENWTRFHSLHREWRDQMVSLQDRIRELGDESSGTS